MNKYKDHESVEKAEKWWKSLSKVSKLIFLVATGLIVYSFVFGG